MRPLRHASLTLACLALACAALSPAAAQDDPLDNLFGDRSEDEGALPERPGPLVDELIRRARYEQALTIIREFRQRDPKDWDWLLREGEVLLAMGRQEALAAPLAAALEAEPLNVRLLTLAGRLAEDAGRLGGARKAYEAAIKQNPTSDAGLLASLRLGGLLLDAGERDGAREAWLRLLNFYEKQPRLTADQLWMVGEACRKLDLCPKAKAQFAQPMYKYAQLMFDQALKLDDRHVPSWVSYGEAYSEKFNFADGRKTLQIALDIGRSNPQVRVALANALLGSYELGSRRYELASFHLNEALAVHPLMPEALVALAHLRISDNDYVGALDLARRGLERNPNHVGLRAVAGAAHVFRGDMAAFEAEWTELAKARPACAAYFATVAETVGARFRYTEARDLARRALKVDPDYHPALSTLAINLTRTGFRDEGFEVLEKAQRADPFNVYVFNVLQVLTKMRDPQQFKTVQTRHFELTLPVEEEASAPFILDLLERAWRELGSKYGAQPPKVYVEFFSKIEDFSARSIGLPFIGALGVCFGNTMTILSAKEKRLGANAWGRTLWHEYTHVVTLTRTDNRVPRWLTEGLSVYEESRGNANWVREYDRSLMAARRGGYILPISEFDAGFHKPKFGGQVLLSYFQGGLICEFITEEWGFARILKLLDGFREGKSQAQAVEAAFGMTEAEFDRRFLRYMDQRYAGYPASALAPNPFAQMLQGVVIRTERGTLRDALIARPWDESVRGRLARTYSLMDKRADARTLALDLKKRVELTLPGVITSRQAALARGQAGAAELAAARILELRQALGDAEATLARLALDERQAEAAQAGFERALALGASDAPLLRQSLANLAIAREDYADAARHLEALVRIIPPEAQVHRQLRFVYLKLKEPAKALEQLVLVCLRDSADLESRLKAAQVLAAEARWQDLARVLGDVTFIDPFQPEAHFLLGEALRHTGEAARAVEVYEIAMAVGFVNTERCHLGQALCLEALGEREAALKAARRALELDGSLAEAQAVIDRLTD